MLTLRVPVAGNTRAQPAQTCGARNLINSRLSSKMYTFLFIIRFDALQGPVMLTRHAVP